MATNPVENLPTEFQQFASDIRAFFREIKKLIVFVRNGKNFNATIVVLTLALAIAAFIQATIYGLQLGPLRNGVMAARDSAHTATVTMRLDERAWLMLDTDYSDDFKLRGTEEIAVPIRLRDIGKTPARKVDGFIVVDEIRPGENPNFMAKVVTHLWAGIIWPNFPNEITAKQLDDNRLPMKTNPAQRRQFEHGDIGFIVWGKINYEDIFRKPHWIQFCHTISSNPAVHSKQCADYNEIDVMDATGA